MTWLDDTEEALIADIWLLSFQSDISGASNNYSVVKDACKKYKMDIIDVFKVCKSMTSHATKKD